MKFDLIQFKCQGITDRDAPSLYGAAPERDLFQLWADKVDIEDSSRQANDGLLAVQALKIFEESLDLPTSLKLFFAQEENMPFLRAIIDAGSFEEKTFVRIVVQNEPAHSRVLDGHLPVRGGRVPERNWIEMQHQMTVAGFEKMFFVSTLNGEQINVLAVHADPVFISNHIAECILFWDHVRRGTPPPGAVIPPDQDEDALFDPPVSEEKFYTAFVFSEIAFIEDADIKPLHCTHKYLGKLSDEKRKQVEDQIDAYFDGILGHPTFPRVRFDKEGFFGPDKALRVLVPEIYDVNDFFPALRSVLSDFRKEDYEAYIPHVTCSLPSINAPFVGFALLSNKKAYRFWKNKKHLF